MKLLGGRKLLAASSRCLVLSRHGCAQVLLHRYTRQDDIAVGSPMCASSFSSHPGR